MSEDHEANDQVRAGSGRLGSGVIVHGGAGHVEAARRAHHEEGCRAAAEAGWAVLRAGGTALDAAQAAAVVLEDLPQFNAGTGAALNERGEVEHDAAIACGSSLRVGAVASLRGFANPIRCARAVLEDGRHVLLVAEGARELAQARGIALVDPASLVTEAARAALARALAGQGGGGWAGGTIGAVARDARGRVAAATSTGGTVAKRSGRVGDSPIVGAGTLADASSCAVSVTGDGESILKVGLARVVALDVERGAALLEALRAGVTRMLDRTGGTGGLIAIGAKGGWAWARSTATMSWAVAGDAGSASGI